jgi:hypothetical protein
MPSDCARLSHGRDEEAATVRGATSRQASRRANTSSRAQWGPRTRRDRDGATHRSGLSLGYRVAVMAGERVGEAVCDLLRMSRVAPREH